MAAHFFLKEYGHTAVGFYQIATLEDFQLTPNPFNDELEIKISVNEPSELSLKIIDLDGKLIMEKNISVSRIYSTKLNLNHLPSAVYFLSLESENGKIVKRILKK